MELLKSPDCVSACNDHKGKKTLATFFYDLSKECLMITGEPFDKSMAKCASVNLEDGRKVELLWFPVPDFPSANVVCNVVCLVLRDSAGKGIDCALQVYTPFSVGKALLAEVTEVTIVPLAKLKTEWMKKKLLKGVVDAKKYWKVDLDILRAFIYGSVDIDDLAATLLPPRKAVVLTQDEYDEELSTDVAIAAKRSAEERQKRLADAPKRPKQVTIHSVGYRRNPDVIAQVLDRAMGKCERCKKDAPFKRRMGGKLGGKPYLEVHHTRPLSQDGEDTVENAEALCPNCHREAHHG